MYETYRTRPVQIVGHAGTNLGRATGRDLFRRGDFLLYDPARNRIADPVALHAGRAPRVADRPLIGVPRTALLMFWNRSEFAKN